MFVVAIVTLLENSRDSSEQYARTVAFLRKGNSFGVSTMHGVIGAVTYDRYSSPYLNRCYFPYFYSYRIMFTVAIVTLLENSRDSSEQYARTVAFLRKGNSFGMNYPCSLS